MAKPTIALQCRQLMDKRQFKAVLVLLEEQPNAFTDKLEYYLLQSEAYVNLNNGHAALEAAQKALAMAPNNARAFLCRGGAYWRLRSFEKAIKDYETSIALAPNFAKPHNGLGFVYQAQNEYAKAEEQYKLAIAKDSDFAYAHNGLGNLYFVQKDYTKAIEEYRLAILKDTDFAHPYNGLGNVFRLQREYAKAIEYYTQAIEKAPREAMFFHNRGDAYRGSRAYEKSIADYERALELDPSDYWAWEKRNDVLALQGKYQAVKVDDKEKSSVPVFIKALIDEKLQSEAEQTKTQVMKLGSTVASVVNDIRALAFTEAREPVAHYTKLLVANIIVNKPAETSKLRYYNVAYMNDPEEGKVLLQMLTDLRGKDIKKIIDCFDAGKIREDNNVYLGSFVPVSHQDELVMWRTYGKENNVEASGCCMVIAPNFFDGENSPLQRDFGNSEGKAMAAANTDIREKEALYSVVYYNKKLGSEDNRIIGDKANEIQEGLKKLIEALHNLVALIKEKEPDSNLASVVNRVVFRTLSEIRYLFKSADYSFEKELRVIQYVNGESDRVQIDETGGLPHRLYIESGQSIKPSLQKIILGPKVANPDQWLYLEVKMKKEKFKLELEKSNVQFQ